jgi:tetratricopeptide (TPR) repeat protein
VLLLAWGTIDQVRYYFALHQDNLADLERAAALDSFDSSLQMRLGRKELAIGQTQQAAESWRQAVRVNPANPAPRNALLRYLTAQQRFDEAYALTGDGLRYLPRDVDLLVNHGILAKQRGAFDEAVADWKKAISVDAKQSLAHLYLAGELDREGKLEAAVPQYMIFLELAAKAEPADRVPANNVILVALRLAQCQAKTAHPREAVESYGLAQKIAAQIGEPKLESLASVGQATLEAAEKNVPQALDLYQHALTLDRAADDRQSEAADWYSYALFLRSAGFPTRAIYPCLVRAEFLMQSLKDPTDLSQVKRLRQAAENQLAAEGPRLERNPQAGLEDALHLRAP